MSYGRIVVECIQMIRNFEEWLSDAATYAQAKSFDVDVLLNSRLAPDMGNLIYQVRSACDYVKGAAGWLTGREPPHHTDDERTLQELRARIDKTVKFAESVDPEQYAGASQRRIAHSMAPDGTVSEEEYLISIALPNVFFHVTTGYAILRHNGVELGKRRYLGLTHGEH
ncbi:MULTISPECIES: DUF1993 family protein [Burkholderiaceae]|uniref:DUF1993 domain-containing protein n=1 Tax=Caballeronia zhejiangensis TaxID=871203 RepID=A0A656QL82_9BURK|nr:MULTISPECIES: DUF1993 domain-containing protein [Burkholderiaceae]KAK43923.1 hypothetical protein BG58_28620 [Caballeronia jiangsuensis]KDR28782.1 hypothetical protein BG60_09125 [Caballeronia zhejiangensis]